MSFECGADSYVHKTLLEGWNVCMDSVLFDGTDLGDRVETDLLEDMQYVEGVLEPDVISFLRDNTTIYVEQFTNWPGAVYHPSSDWLTNNGYPAYWAKSVMLEAEPYLSSDSDCQPATLLHELAHSYHHQHLGYDY